MVHHSVRGSQYVSITHSERLAEAGIERLWEAGDSYDNAVAETNHHRLLELLDYIPPAEAEENYYKQLSSQIIPA